MPRYPYPRIVLLYALFGGGLGGLLSFIVPCLIPRQDCLEIPTLTTVFTMLIFSIVFGCLPAVFTGIALAALRRYRSFASSIIASIIGAMVSSLYILITLPRAVNVHEIAILCAVIGAIASFILSLFLPPKSSLKP